MIHERKITLTGDPAWIKRTLENSLPDGVNAEFLKKGDSITVETLTGDPVCHGIPGSKPEKRFDARKPVMIYLLCVNVGSITKIEAASLNSETIGALVYKLNGEEDGADGPYYSFSTELES